MASKKKPKKSRKAKKAKARAKAKPALKKTKKVKKKVVKKKKSAARKPVKRKAKPARKVAAAKPAPAAPAGGERIGIVTHYYNHLGVAIIQLDTGTLRSGETVHIKGHTSDFRQMVGSMEVNHAHVDTVRAGTSFGLRVNEHAREHDIVYRVAGT